MLTKEEFTKHITHLKKLFDAADELYNATNKAFDLLEIDSVSYLIDDQIELVEKAMDDDEDLIGTWFSDCIINTDTLWEIEIDEFYDKLKGSE